MHIKQIDEFNCKACKLFIHKTDDDLRNHGIKLILMELNKRESQDGGIADCCTSWSGEDKVNGFLIHLLPAKAIVGAVNIFAALNVSPDGLMAEVRNFKYLVDSDTS
ncbi:MAG: hypothetical protein Q8O93_01720 [bacterium]|nr:hypothetical protein [bacterium]